MKKLFVVAYVLAVLFLAGIVKAAESSRQMVSVDLICTRTPKTQPQWHQPMFPFQRLVSTVPR